METYNYFLTCEKCDDDECCKEPYYAFASKIEIQRIKDYIKKEKFPKKFTNFLNREKFIYKNKENEVLAIRKIDGSCIFLKDNRFCMIQKVKPLDCRQWPLTFDYIEKEDKLIIYKGVCPLSDILKEQWIESMVNIIETELQSWPLEDLAAYSSYDRDDTLIEIRVVENYLKNKDK